MSLEELINQVDPVTFKIPHGWTGKIKTYYYPFVKEIWTNSDAIKTITHYTKTEQRRLNVLFKYWALNKITTLYDAKKTIPICPICKNDLCIPASVDPTGNRTWIVGCCHKRYCCGKYKNNKTTDGMLRIHGVLNANDMPDMKMRKSELIKKAVEERGKEILKTRQNTIQNTYGSQYTNISQLPDIKKTKEDTCFLNYGVTNPDYILGINAERSYKTVNTMCNQIVINRKVFSVMDPSEAEFLRIMARTIPVEYIESNEVVLERMINGRSKCNVVDIAVNNKVFIELKSTYLFDYRSHLANSEYVGRRLELVIPLLQEDQRYIFYVRHPKESLTFIVDNKGEIKIRTTGSDLKTAINCFGDYRCYKCQNKKFNIKDMDDFLIQGIYFFPSVFYDVFSV